jgi:hypothetical protein
MGKEPRNTFTILLYQLDEQQSAVPGEGRSIFARSNGQTAWTIGSRKSNGECLNVGALWEGYGLLGADSQYLIMGDVYRS